MSKVRIYELKENDKCSIDCRDNGVNLQGPLTIIVVGKEVLNENKDLVSKV